MATFVSSSCHQFLRYFDHLLCVYKRAHTHTHIHTQAADKHNSTAAFMSPSAIKSSGMHKGPVKKPVSAKTCTSVIDGLKQIYFSKVKDVCVCVCRERDVSVQRCAQQI